MPHPAARLLLVINSFFFAGFGVAFLVAPDALGAAVDLTPASEVARVELRAMYGGVEIGLAAFLLACAVRPELVRVGLALSACLLAGLALGRVGGMALEGVWPAPHPVFAAVELAGAALSAVGARSRSLAAQVNGSH